ncbi:MAG: hypothetical protein U0703_04190 [Anaerolineae bacterium]
MVDLRAIIKQVGLTAIYVTHDQHEAFIVADRIALMNAGSSSRSARRRRSTAARRRLSPRASSA